MINIDRQILRQYSTGEKTADDLATYLLYNYPAHQIAVSLIEALSREPSKPIAITEEEFSQHFRIKGTKVVDGMVLEERRGRKSQDRPTRIDK